MPNDKPQNSLPALQHDGWTEISHMGVRWQFSDAELALWDTEMEGFHFYAFHELVLPTTETMIAFIETQTVDTETNECIREMEQAKVEILSCMDNSSHVIHNTPDETSFLMWWEANGSGDLGLTQPQLLDVYRQLRTDIYTFDSCLAEYRRFLLGHPQHALRIGDREYAYLQPNGVLIGLSVADFTTIDQADVFDFDSDAFNTSIGGWMDESYVETRRRITEPEFKLVTVTFPPES